MLLHKYGEDILDMGINTKRIHLQLIQSKPFEGTVRDDAIGLTEWDEKLLCKI